MKIPDWISTNVIDFEKTTSRAYISNLLNFELYWLNGVSSDLWKVILTSQDYNNVLEYAKKRQIENELQSFLEQLKSKKILIDDNTDEFTIKESSQKKLSDMKIGKSFLDRWSNLNVQEKKLTRIQFELTYKCNENCVHCLNDKDIPNIQIRYEDIKPIIDDAYDIGLTQIVLSGGECTLADDFLKIAKYIREKRIELVFFTNGQKLYDDDFFEEIIKLYPYSIGISLYSMDPEIHDFITRTKGSHKKTLSVINKLISYNIPVEIKCFLTKYNADSFKDVLNFAVANNCKYNMDECLVPNKYNDNLYTEITDKQLKELYKYIYIKKLQKLTYKKGKNFFNEVPCKSGRTTLDINPLLNVTSCPTANIIFGNLHDISLKELWKDSNPNSPINKWKIMRNKDYTNCFKNDYCDYCNFCPGKYTSENLRYNHLCKKAKLKMEIVKNNEF